MKSISIAVMSFLLACGASAAAQAPDPAAPGAPTLVRVDGRLTTATGEPRTGVVLMVASLYAEKNDTTPLWTEQQTITLDDRGRYSIVAGATLADGVPKEFFQNASARWLGVGVQGEVEDQRTMFVTVPYALKAREADTLAGKSATDFVLADTLKDTVKSAIKTASKGTDPGTAGTMNYLPKFDASGVAGNIVDSAVYEAGGFVGIGMTAPPTALTLLQDGQISWANAAGTNQRVTLYGSSGNYFTVNLLGAEKLRVTPTGVGISQSVPASMLSLPQDEAITWANPGGTARVSLVGSSANSFALNLLNSEKLRVDSSGNVGIGTSTPGYPLSFPNTLGDKISLWGQSGAHYGLGIQGALLQIHADQINSSIAFGYGSSGSFTEVMRVKGNGTVGIGTTTPNSAWKLYVDSGASVTGGGAIYASTDNGNAYGISGSNFSNGVGIDGFTVNGTGVHGRGSLAGWGVFGESNSGYGVYGLSNSGYGVLGSSTSNYAGYFIGNVYVTGTITQNSDVRLKQGIRSLGYGLPEVLRLRPVSWTWKQASDGAVQLGLLAQDVEAVLPELVTTAKNDEQTKGINYIGLVPVMISAIQEQQDTIAMLNARLAALEQALRRLGARP